MEKIFSIVEVDPIVFCGVNDRNLKIIEQHFQIMISGRGDKIRIVGEADQVEQVEDLFSELIFIINKKKQLSRNDLFTTIKIIKSDYETTDQLLTPKNELDSVVVFTDNGHIKPKSKGQDSYFKAVQNNDIVFCIGPAGTGKTYLAVAMAVAYFKNKSVKKIILSRPAVEAGESLGFLPGDFKEKIDPYLRPLYDALTEIMPGEILKKNLDQQNIEVIPLAYMRGRTLNNAFVLLDEAQNCTYLQMKMFLTRLGFNSKCIVNGDITQIDLPKKSESGLLGIDKILEGIEGIEFINLDSNDVVRHKLVTKIIDAYSRSNDSKNNGSENK